jgi:hypothetical protein
LKFIIKKNLIELKRLSVNLKKIRQNYGLDFFLNSKVKKINTSLIIFSRAMKIIFSSIRLWMFERIEVFKIIFWENKIIFSDLFLTKKFKKQEVLFFEIYNFLVNLSSWESGIKYLFHKNLYLNPFLEKFCQKNFSFQKKRRIKSNDRQSFVPKNSVLFSWSYS